jgi:hypothetical protein
MKVKMKCEALLGGIHDYAKKHIFFTALFISSLFFTTSYSIGIYPYTKSPAC